MMEVLFKSVRSRLDGFLFMPFCRGFQGRGKAVASLVIKSCQEVDRFIAQAKEVLLAGHFNEAEGFFGHEMADFYNFYFGFFVGMEQGEPLSGKAIDD